jgi:hypothetical protein
MTVKVADRGSWVTDPKVLLPWPGLPTNEAVVVQAAFGSRARPQTEQEPRKIGNQERRRG